MPRNDQVSRQWHLLRRLDSPHGASLDDLVSALPDDFPKNPRTIRRDLEALEFAGFPMVAAWVKDKAWHPSQGTALFKDGRLKMALKVADTDELTGWILSFGSQVRVIRPETLRVKVRNEAKALLKLQ